MIHEPVPPPDEPPFIAEVTNTPEKGQKFRPTARIVIGHGIRGLARSVGVEAVGILAVMASLVTTNGKIAPSARILARALGRVFLRRRLARLTRQIWRGQPLLKITRTGNGVETYRMSDRLLERRETPPAFTAAPQGAARSFRQAIVDQSRQTYARKRQDVEHDIEVLMGWRSAEEAEQNRAAHPKLPADQDDRWAVARLVKEQVDYSLAVKLVKDYGAERVLQQLKWLDQRKAKNRARFVVGAIIQDYPAPGTTPRSTRTLPPSPDQ